MPATNVQKTPLLSSFLTGTQRQSLASIQTLGKCLPCSVVSVTGAIVTVKFELQSAPWTLPQVTMPVFGPEYVRWPIQVGDKGMAIAADFQIGQMSGLADATPSMSQPSNLGALTFMPIGNKTWQAVDGQSVVIYGPNGVVLRDAQSRVTFTLSFGGLTIDLHNNGPVAIMNGDLRVSGSITAGYGGADSVTLQHHTHTQPSDSHGDGESPTNAPTAGT
jgi:hypothetical protein